jgi:hypothetical protein
MVWIGGVSFSRIRFMSCPHSLFLWCLRLLLKSCTFTLDLCFALFALIPQIHHINCIHETKPCILTNIVSTWVSIDTKSPNHYWTLLGSYTVEHDDAVGRVWFGADEIAGWNDEQKGWSFSTMGRCSMHPWEHHTTASSARCPRSTIKSRAPTRRERGFSPGW